jgi:hypothetical protein
MHLLTYFAALWTKPAGDSGPLDPATQKTQLNRLLTVAVARASAEISLPDCSSLQPFAVWLNVDGRIWEALEILQPAEPPDADTMVFRLRDAGQRAVAACRILAYTVVSGMRLIPIGRLEKSDAIVVDLHHRDGLSFTVYHPYRVDDDRRITIERPFLSAGPQSVQP